MEAQTAIIPYLILLVSNQVVAIINTWAGIGGKIGGSQDAILEGKTGYICDGDDLNSIYESVIKFFDNDNYKRVGLNALEFSKKFKWDKIVKKYLNLI